MIHQCHCGQSDFVTLKGLRCSDPRKGSAKTAPSRLSTLQLGGKLRTPQCSLKELRFTLNSLSPMVPSNPPLHGGREARKETSAGCPQTWKHSSHSTSPQNTLRAMLMLMEAWFEAID